MVIGKLIIKDLHRDQLISNKLELFKLRFITVNNRTCPCACRGQRRENLRCKNLKILSNVFNLRIL